MGQKYVVIDVETTGTSPRKGAKIIEIGAVLMEDEEVLDTLSTFIQPHMPIPPFIQQFTGIRDQDVEHAPEFYEVAPTLTAWLEDAAFVGHNVQFDLAFINAGMQEAGFPLFQGPVVDTVECARLAYPEAPGFRLSQITSWLDLDHDRPHRADSDALVTAELWISIRKKLAVLPKDVLHRLDRLAAFLHSDLHRYIERCIAKAPQQLPYDLEENHGIVFRKELPAEKPEQRNVSMQETLSGSHAKSRGWERFEERPGQLEMAEMVYASFEERSHAVIEAGTGLGKTLAYLLPAVKYHRTYNQKILISTQTLTLQEQLMNEDLPLLERLIDDRVSVAVLKGRGNYISLQRFEKWLQHRQFSLEEALGLGQVLIWLTETRHGDLDEINMAGGRRNALWESLRQNHYQDEHAQRGWEAYCFYARARRKAEYADIVVTNHAMLLSDMYQGKNLFSAYPYVIIDEAHHLPETAGKYAGRSVHYTKANRLLRRFGLDTKQSVVRPLIWFGEEAGIVFEPGWYQEREDNHAVLMYECDELFRLLTRWCRSASGRRRSEVGRYSQRFMPGRESGPVWEQVEDAGRRFLTLLEQEFKAWEAFGKVWETQPSSTSFVNELAELNAYLEQLDELGDNLFHLLFEREPEHVYWVEAEQSGAKNAAYIYARPVEVASELSEQLFMKKASVVLTSGSLAVNGSFEYMKSKMGLNDFLPQTSLIDSPYHYASQTQLLVPKDISGVNDKHADFAQEAAEYIFHAVNITEGKTMVLFTSFNMLKQVYHQLKEWTEESTLSVIGQGITSGTHAKLTKLFQQQDNALLLGTNAFWEGVDIPGEKLQHVIIVRLPFSPPTDPVYEAVSDKMQRQGKRSFYAEALPHAVLRFKQGFGRLIRHSEDRGVVTVLDKRIMEASYGSSFIDSIPRTNTYYEPMDAVLDRIADFFEEAKKR